MLGNGLRVLFFPDDSEAKVTVNITYFVGSKHEGYGETGMAHLLEHMVFKGTPSRPNMTWQLSIRWRPRRSVKTLKTDVSKIGVAVGSASPFQVEETAPGVARLVPSCSTVLGNAVPGVRLRDFQAEFGSRGLLRTLCNANLAGDLVAIADLIADGLL